ncbi:hypothetical protein F4808DRAFT_462179 [Astrocystis sublimbata]|nr:hypothetical protein F4808DRAFT_462179 [Astrocystis sublimbata]
MDYNMSSHNHSDATVAQATTKPRAKKSVKREDLEPMPYQKLKQERQDKLNAARKRQARNMERPTDDFLSEHVLFTKHVTANPSYDDNPNKRRKMSHGPKTKKLARRAPWSKDEKLKKPSLPPVPPVGSAPRGQNPIAAMGCFMELPTEIRDEVLRFLLLWPKDIIVFDKWSRVFPRLRPKLNLSILRTCQVLRMQGLRILYGENKFVYDLRDPAASHDHTLIILDRVFGNSSMPIDVHGHLIRHIGIKIHRSRLHSSCHRRNFKNALLKFLPEGELAHPAQLHTITLTVPAITRHDLDMDSSQGEEEKVLICRYFRRDSGIIKALLGLQVQWVRIVAEDVDSQLWEANVDMRYHAKDQKMKLDYEALKKERKHNDTDGADHQGGSDPNTAGSYRTKDIEAMMKLWDRRVKKAISQVLSLGWRIERLAIDPDRAVMEKKLWVAAKEPVSDPNEEFDRLPDNYRDPSSSICTRSSRTRPPLGSYKLKDHAITTRPKGKSKAEPRALAGSRSRNVNQLDARGAVNEARLLEAQRASPVDGTTLAERGMLTEEWLESLPVEEEINKEFNDGDEPEK